MNIMTSRTKRLETGDWRFVRKYADLQPQASSLSFTIWDDLGPHLPD